MTEEDVDEQASRSVAPVKQKGEFKHRLASGIACPIVICEAKLQNWAKYVDTYAECFRTRVRLPPPPPFEKRQPVSPQVFSGTTCLPTGRRVFYFPLFSKGLRPFYIFSGPVLHPPDSPSFLSLNSLFAPRFSVFSGRSPKLVRLDNPFYIKDLSRPAVFASLETRPVV